MEKERLVGEGKVRIGSSISFREDLYNLCFVSQAKSIYRESCIEIEENREHNLHKVRAKLFGDEPPAPEDFEEENLVE